MLCAHKTNLVGCRQINNNNDWSQSYQDTMDEENGKNYGKRTRIEWTNRDQQQVQL